MFSGLDFGALSLGGARFVPCGSSGQLYRAVPGPVSDWHQPVGVGHAARVIMGNKVGCTVRGGIGIWAGDLSWIVCEFGFS